MDTINPGLRTAVAGVSPSAGFNAVDVNFRPPESWQWNVTLSHEVIKNTVAEVSYIGNHGLHIWRRALPFNEVLPSARLALVRAARDAQPTQPIIDANRRLRGLGPITMSQSTGDSDYHAMQVWVNRRFTQRLAFQAAYTWSHTISNVPLTSFTSATTDPFNYDLDKGDAAILRSIKTLKTINGKPAAEFWKAVDAKKL